MNSRLLNCLAGVVVGMAGASCRPGRVPETPGPNASPTAVAVVAGAEISESALRAELQRRFRHPPDGGWSAEQKQEALERLIQNEAIHAQAQASGFAQSPEMQARIKSLIVAQYREQRFTKTTPTVSDAEVEAAYRAQAGRFTSGAASRGAAIFIAVPVRATAEKKAEFRARAEGVRAEAQGASEPEFARLALRHSEDQATRYRGGDLGWVTPDRAGVEPALAEALFALTNPGQVGPLVQTARGFQIVKLLEKREASRQPLSAVQATIRYQLSREKTAQAERDFHASMKRGLDIQVNRALLERISPPAERIGPPPSPGVITAQVRKEP